MYINIEGYIYEYMHRAYTIPSENLTGCYWSHGPFSFVELPNYKMVIFSSKACLPEGRYLHISTINQRVKPLVS